MSREDQYDVEVTLTKADGTILSLGTFDKMSGGEMDSEETKYRPGNMGDQVTLGGYRTVGNVTVTRLFSLTRDQPNVATWMRLAGRAKMKVVKISLDVDKNPFGSPLVYEGTLKQVTPPDHDSESSDAAMIAMEMTSATIA